MAVAADNGVLQDEVERILRKLTLEETRAVAEHMQIENLQADATKRDLLRSIQDTFDAAADDAARNVLLHGLPVPEPHRADYDLLLNPPPAPVEQQNQVVPGADAAAAAAAAINQGQVGDQVVPLNNVGQQNAGVPQVAVQQNVGALPVNDGGLVAQHNLGGGLQGNPQVAQHNLVGLQAVNGAQIAQQNVNNGGPLIQQNFGAGLQLGNIGGAAIGGNINGVRQNNMGNVQGVAGQQYYRFGGVPQGVAAAPANVYAVPNQVQHAGQNLNFGGANVNPVGGQPLNAAGGNVGQNVAQSSECCSKPKCWRCSTHEFCCWCPSEPECAVAWSEYDEFSSATTSHAFLSSRVQDDW